MAFAWRRFAAIVARHRSLAAAAAILLLSAGLFAVDLGGIWGGSARPFGQSPWWGFVTVVPGCLLVAVQRRRPLLALTAGAGLLVVDVAWFGTVGMLLVVNELIYSATMSLTPRGRRRMLAGLVAVTAGVVVTVAVATGELRLCVLAALLALAFLGTPFWWATAVRRAQEVAELHARRAEDAARLTELREQDAVRRERSRMAGELHDVIAGHLSAVALRSEAALARAAHEPRDREALAAIRQASLRSLEEMRDMITLLRSGEDPVAAADRLDRLPEILAAATGLAVHVEADELPELPAAVDQAAARIVREALLNAAKHAAGGEARVRIAATDGGLRVDVVSRGGSPSGTGGAGLGLITLRERAEALGGSFAAGPDDEGWHVTAELPARVPA